MPFDVSEKYIKEMEQKLGVTFPASFHDGMCCSNGGTVGEWELYPVADTSNRKRLKRTCSDIIDQTNAAREWRGFPEDGIALARNGCGGQAVVLADFEHGSLDERVFEWCHETGELTMLSPTLEIWLNSRD